MALRAGPLYTKALMGQGPSVAEREHARKASSTILREDSFRIEESENVSLADSWSMHFDCTTQAPYSPVGKDIKIPRTDLPRGSRENPLYELALFLRNTGPLAPHRRPSKMESPSPAIARRRKALQFLKLKQQNVYGEIGMDHKRSCAELRDEGGLLSNLPVQPIPKYYEQKVSSTGQKYLALQDPQIVTKGDADIALQSPSVVESRVSICFTDSINPRFTPDGQERETDDESGRSKIHPTWRRLSWELASTDAGAVLGAFNNSSNPVRPPASDPPTPEPLSAVSFAESHLSDLTEQPSNRSIDISWPTANHHTYASTSSSLPLPQILDNTTIPTIQHPFKQRNVEMEHPSPRRFASHNALLQRSSTIASCHRSTSDSPGPPPRSPLRLQRESGNIEEIINSYNCERPRLRAAPVIQGVKGVRSRIQPIRPTVVTDCTGPIKRPTSRGSDPRGSPPYSSAQKEREERTKARKIRDRPVVRVSTPTPTQTIDAIVHAPLTTPRHRLRKARPHIQIPDLRPPPLTTRVTSGASSNASWKKATESTRTPVSAVPSEGTVGGTPTTNGEKTGYTPISPTASNASATAEARMALSPVMLIAEEVPIPKLKQSPNPARLVVREGKSYAPRPRSASIPRSAMKRRSHRSGQTPSRPGSPSREYDAEEAPPLPSPPPNRALPPTPPASGSEKPKRTKATSPIDHEKELPLLPADKIISELKETTPHVVSQVRKKPVASTESGGTRDIHARLEALERQNALLSAALTAVLRTNGTVNGPLSNLPNSLLQRPPMAWQQRMERRSAASHGSSNSNDSALKLYHNTRKENLLAP